MSLALTPPMGWNSWNTFGHNINETVIRETEGFFEGMVGINPRRKYITLESWGREEGRHETG